MTSSLVRSVGEDQNRVGSGNEPIDRGHRQVGQAVAGEVSGNNGAQSIGRDHIGQVVEGAIPKPTVRAPGPKLIDSLKSAGTDIDTTARLRDTFKPEYGGNTLTGSLENFYLRNKPGGDDSGQAQWWQDYQAYVNGVRNKLFGAALTPSEQAEFEKAIVTPRMSPVESKKNLERQAELAAKAAKRLADPNVALGVDREVIEGSLGYTLDDLGKMNTKGVTPGPQANGGPPQGVDPKVWSHMTPEEKSLWK